MDLVDGVRGHGNQKRKCRGHGSASVKTPWRPDQFVREGDEVDAGDDKQRGTEDGHYASHAPMVTGRPGDS